MNTYKTENQHAYKMGYKKLAWMAILSYIAMFFLMYAMVDKFENVVPNINQFYMAGLMTASMIIIELILMRDMYKKKELNLLIIAISTTILISCFLFIQNQTAVSEKQFLKSMIPHHAAAVLMVKEAHIFDPEIKKLADGIITSQQKEIDFMKTKLNEMNGK